MGKDEKTLLELAARQNMPIPDKILNAPELQPGLQLYIDAFNDLTYSRFNTQGFVGRIHYTSMSQWCYDHNIDGDQRLDMIHLLTQMDQAYTDWHFSYMKRNAPKPQGQPKRPPSTR